MVGFIRPKPGAAIRKGWNHLHHWLGRLTIISAWATIYLGIYMAHGSTAYNASLKTWLIPVVTVMGCLVLIDIALSFAVHCMPAPRPPIGSAWGGEEPYRVTDERQRRSNDVDKAGMAPGYQSSGQRSTRAAANFYVLSD